VRALQSKLARAVLDDQVACAQLRAYLAAKSIYAEGGGQTTAPCIEVKLEGRILKIVPSVVRRRLSRID
jgi:hypothetical protein